MSATTASRPFGHLEFAPPAQPGLWGGWALALGAHALLALALAWGTQWQVNNTQDTVQAELWATVPAQAAPRLAEPEPQPTLPPPTQTPDKPLPPPPVAVPPEQSPDIVLQRQEQLRKQQENAERLQRQEKDKLSALQAEIAKKEAAAKTRDAAQKLLKQQAFDKAAREAEEAAEAKRVEAQRVLNLRRMAGLAGATGDANAAGQAAVSQGPSASYAGRIKGRIKPNIVFTDDVAGNPKAEVEVRTAPDGTIIGRRVVKASGVRNWDEAVLKAIDKTEILPKDENGRVPPVLIIEFRPRD